MVNVNAYATFIESRCFFVPETDGLRKPFVASIDSWHRAGPPGQSPAINVSRVATGIKLGAQRLPFILEVAMMKPWMTAVALLAVLLVQSCAMPTTTSNAAGTPKPMPDFGSKAYGY